MAVVPESAAIVNALRSGLVPGQGLEHFATGLDALVEAVNQEYREAAARLGIDHARDDRVATATLQRVAPTLGVDHVLFTPNRKFMFGMYQKSIETEEMHSPASIQRAMKYSERPNRFLYGTDWPLAPMIAYREFIRQAVPPENHDQVFEENARTLFRLG